MRRTKTCRTAAVTGAGTLPACAVIHAVGPFWDDYSEEENDRLLASATTAALKIACERGLASIAFPAVSSGIFGFPKHRCAEVMIGAVVAWWKAHPDDDPCDLRFTIIDEPTVSFSRRRGSADLGRTRQGRAKVNH